MEMDAPATPSTAIVPVLSAENVEVPTTEEQSKRRRKKSIVWEHFTIETVGAGCMRACCKQCKKSFAYITGSKLAGTSHLKRHISLGICPVSRQKNNEAASLTPGPKSEPPKKRQRQSPGWPTIPFDQDRCTHEIAKMIIQHEYPLHIVEHPAFIDFVRTLQPQYNMVSFNTIQGECVALYLREKQNLLNLICEIPGRVNLTVDLGISNQSIGYAFLRGHFVDADWNLHRRLLNVVMLPFPDSDYAFNQAVASCLSDWHLENKLFTLTLDQSFANETMIGNLRGLLSVRNPFVLNAQLLKGSCYARVLSRLAQDALAAMGDTVRRIRESVKYVKTSDAHDEKFAELRQQLQVPSTKELIIDDQTKWNTTYQMLVAACELKEVFACLDTSDPIYKINPSIEDWKQVDILCTYLKLFYDAANVLTAPVYPPANVFYHEVSKIQLELTHAAMSLDPFVSSLTRPLKENFDKYWRECFLALAVAVVMDPRFKMKLVEFSFSRIFGEDAGMWIKIVDDSIHELFDDYLPPHLSMPPTYVEGQQVMNSHLETPHDGSPHGIPLQEVNPHNASFQVVNSQDTHPQVIFQEVHTHEIGLPEVHHQELESQELPAQEVPPQEANPQEVNAQDAPCQQVHAPEVPPQEMDTLAGETQQMDTQEAPSQQMDTQGAPLDQMEIEEAPIEQMETQKAPPEEAGTKEAAAQDTNDQEAPTQEVHNQASLQEMNHQEVASKEVDNQETSSEEVNNQEAASKEVDTKAAPSEEVYIQEAPSNEVDTKAAPSEEVNIQEAPSKEVDTKAASSEEVNNQEAASQEVNTEAAPSQEADSQEAASQEVNTEAAPSQEADGQDAASQEVNTEAAPSQEADGQDAASQEVNTKAAPSQEVDGTEAASQEVHTQEAPCKEMNGPEVVLKENVQHPDSQEMQTEIEMNASGEPLQETNNPEAASQEKNDHEAPPQEATPQEAPPQQIHFQDPAPEEVQFQEAPPEEMQVQEAPSQEVQVQEELPQEMPTQEYAQESHTQEVPIGEMQTEEVLTQEMQIDTAQPEEMQTQEVLPQEIPNQVLSQEIKHEQMHQILSQEMKHEEMHTQDLPLLSIGDGLSDFEVYISEITSGQHMKSELDQYLEESLLPRVQEFDVLGWWKLNKLKYPLLSKMAADILSIPVCTVAPDSVFDTDTKKIDSYHSSLRPVTLEALVCAKDWLPYSSSSTLSAEEVSNALVKMEY